MNALPFKQPGNYTIRGKVWIDYEGERCFGPGRAELLQRIAVSGSINKAAKARMSYKKAWEMITILNGQLSQPVVITQASGESGGGSVLTPEARKLMQYHTEMQQRFREFLKNKKRSGREYERWRRNFNRF